MKITICVESETVRDYLFIFYFKNTMPTFLLRGSFSLPANRQPRSAYLFLSKVSCDSCSPSTPGCERAAARASGYASSRCSCCSCCSCCSSSSCSYYRCCCLRPSPVRPGLTAPLAASLFLLPARQHRRRPPLERAIQRAFDSPCTAQRGSFQYTLRYTKMRTVSLDLSHSQLRVACFTTSVHICFGTLHHGHAVKSDAVQIDRCGSLRSDRGSRPANQHRHRPRR